MAVARVTASDGPKQMYACTQAAQYMRYIAWRPGRSECHKRPYPRCIYIRSRAGMALEAVLARLEGVAGRLEACEKRISSGTSGVTASVTETSSAVSPPDQVTAAYEQYGRRLSATHMWVDVLCPPCHRLARPASSSRSMTRFSQVCALFNSKSANLHG
eukprot:scaffold48_cov395-Prasinococcus_capsulatus_cf.AAC.3